MHNVENTAHKLTRKSVLPSIGSANAIPSLGEGTAGIDTVAETYRKIQAYAGEASAADCSRSALLLRSLQKENHTISISEPVMDIIDQLLHPVPALRMNAASFKHHVSKS